ncbi:MAG TPA: hypothetical protein VJ784_21085 [Pyrinomonadaceae bacterium]|jgi:hypothetical protein|nr:hypothetical protein [Pyrinomonadaceae bacterium]
MSFIKKRLWVIAPVLCSVVAALVVAKAAYVPVQESTWQQTDLALGQPAVYPDSIEEVLLVLTGSGFAPAEARPHGKKFLLSLDNRTEVKELTLRMARSDGVQIREIHVPAGGGDWSELFELSPGTYKLSEANHESWLCTITIKE